MVLFLLQSSGCCPICINGVAEGRVSVAEWSHLHINSFSAARFRWHCFSVGGLRPWQISYTFKSRSSIPCSTLNMVDFISNWWVSAVAACQSQLIKFSFGSWNRLSSYLCHSLATYWVSFSLFRIGKLRNFIYTMIAQMNRDTKARTIYNNKTHISPN